MGQDGSARSKTGSQRKSPQQDIDHIPSILYPKRKNKAFAIHRLTKLCASSFYLNTFSISSFCFIFSCVFVGHSYVYFLYTGLHTLVIDLHPTLLRVISAYRVPTAHYHFYLLRLCLAAMCYGIFNPVLFEVRNTVSGSYTLSCDEFERGCCYADRCGWDEVRLVLGSHSGERE